MRWYNNQTLIPANTGDAADLMWTPPSSSSPLISFNSPKIPLTPVNNASSCVEEQQSLIREHQEVLRQREQIYSADLLRSQMEYKEKLTEMEIKYKKELSEAEERNGKELNEKDKAYRELECVMEKYVETITELIDEKKNLEKENQESSQDIQKLKRENAQAIAELKEMETTFHKFNQKYERTKEIAASQIENEEILKKKVEELTSTVEKQRQKYKTLRVHAEEKLKEAENMYNEKEKQNIALEKQKEMIIKKYEMRIHGLEAALKQKESDNAELSAICDEIINKVGQPK